MTWPMTAAGARSVTNRTSGTRSTPIHTGPTNSLPGDARAGHEIGRFTYSAWAGRLSGASNAIDRTSEVPHMKPGAMTAGAHRKSRLPAFLSRLRRNRPPVTDNHELNDEPAYDGPEFRHTDSVINVSNPVILAPTHPWRRVSCLICHGWAANDAIRFVTIIDPRTRTEDSWHIGARGYLIHADHGVPERGGLVDLAHKTDYPGCPCNAWSPVADAMTHLHYPTGAYIA